LYCYTPGEALIYDRGAPGAIFNVGILAAVAGAGKGTSKP
jgi:hypothetical protein